MRFGGGGGNVGKFSSIFRAGNRSVSREFVFIITNHLLNFTFDEMFNRKRTRERRAAARSGLKTFRFKSFPCNSCCLFCSIVSQREEKGRGGSSAPSRPRRFPSVQIEFAGEWGGGNENSRWLIREISRGFSLPILIPLLRYPIFSLSLSLDYFILSPFFFLPSLPHFFFAPSFFNRVKIRIVFKCERQFITRPFPIVQAFLSPYTSRAVLTW